MWPFDFVLEYKVKLWITWLEMTLTVHNLNPIAIEFQSLSHNYIHVNNIVKDGLQISGLQGVDYFDKMTKTNHTETRESFGISLMREGQKSIYTPTDGVICNPWIERAANMTDFKDDEYLYMIAIEPGKVIEQQVLEPGTSYKLNQLIMVSKGF
ncbi:unnamed protein product [Hyaloperonospora brassicae]|uniref:Uncharacterized protein n=1 Tax=Hyaloperonospora brassicae TaxID=162125 RepID=A0AAV0TZ59_HYABA|nr:unnamed protein product [Hyaloperonospora brassicae]